MHRFYDPARVNIVLPSHFSDRYVSRFERVHRGARHHVYRTSVDWMDLSSGWKDPVLDRCPHHTVGCLQLGGDLVVEKTVERLPTTWPFKATLSINIAA